MLCRLDKRTHPSGILNRQDTDICNAKRQKKTHIFDTIHLRFFLVFFFFIQKDVQQHRRTTHPLQQNISSFIQQSRCTTTPVRGLLYIRVCSFNHLVKVKFLGASYCVHCTICVCCYPFRVINKIDLGHERKLYNYRNAVNGASVIDLITQHLCFSRLTYNVSLLMTLRPASKQCI